MAELIVEPEAEAELEEAGNRYEEGVPGRQNAHPRRDTLTQKFQ